MKYTVCSLKDIQTTLGKMKGLFPQIVDHMYPKLKTLKGYGDKQPWASQRDRLQKASQGVDGIDYYFVENLSEVLMRVQKGEIKLRTKRCSHCKNYFLKTVAYKVLGLCKGCKSKVDKCSSK